MQEALCEGGGGDARATPMALGAPSAWVPPENPELVGLWAAGLVRCSSLGDSWDAWGSPSVPQQQHHCPQPNLPPCQSGHSPRLRHPSRPADTGTRYPVTQPRANRAGLPKTL